MGRPKKPLINSAFKNTTTAIPTALETAQLHTTEINPASTNEIKLSCDRLGLTLDNYILAIKEALSATRTTVDKYGDEHTDADHDKRLKAALMGLELQGYIRNKVGPVDNSKHTHVTYSWQPVAIVNNNGLRP